MVRRIALLALVTFCAACGGKGSPAGIHPANVPTTTSQPAAVADPVAFKQSQLAQLSTAPVPAGVDPALWRVLKTRLADLLTQFKAVRSAPVSPASAPRLKLDPSSHTFSWGYSLQGDYDQNGEVNIADLQPLGLHYGQHSDNGSAFPYDSVQSVIDGDGNGEINLADLQPIGVNFGAQTQQFNLYSSSSAADRPARPDDPNGAGAVLATAQQRSVGIGPGNQARLQYTYGVFPFTSGTFFWLRPSDGTTDGTASNLVSTGLGTNIAPQIFASAVPAAGEAPLAVKFDASTCVDPDGPHHDITDIVQFEWDLDGDGSFETTTVKPIVNHAYNNPGEYAAALRITDTGGATATSAPFTLKASVGGNLPPVPVLSADKFYGHAVLEVNFDAGSTTDDGGTAGLDFDWDFDGNGTYDFDSGNVPAASHAYSAAGNYEVRLRVTDANGLSATASVPLTVASLQPNIAPYAKLVISQDTYTAPVTATLDLTQAVDPDGSIAVYEIDFEGDGTYDSVIHGPALPASLQHAYPNVGVTYVTLRVTDNLGAQATIMQPVYSAAAGAVAPTGTVTASPPSGVVPLEVTIDASACTVASGSIMDYGFDFEGAGVIEEHGPEPIRHHTYLRPGGFLPTVYLTSDTGGLTVLYTDSVNVTNPANHPPVAKISVQLNKVSYPTTYTLDASGSTDPDGNRLDYEWDLDGDGNDEFSSGPVPYLTHEFAQVGYFQPHVHVYDDQGASDIAVGDAIQITDGWETTYLATIPGPAETAAAFETYGTPAHSRAIVAFCETTGATKPRVCVSEQDGLAQWSQPLAVTTENGSGPVAWCSTSALPELFYTRAGSAGTGGLACVRQLNNPGTSWSIPVSISTTGANTAQEIGSLVVNGDPAVFAINGTTNKVTFARATDAIGFTWPALTAITAAPADPIVGIGPGLLASGKPAVALVTLDVPHFRGNVLFNQAANVNGSAWGATNESVAGPYLPTYAGADRAGFALVDGRPALVFPGFFGELCYARAVDANGASWPQAMLIGKQNYYGNYAGITLLLVDGRPLVVTQRPSLDVIVVEAKDSAGLAWNNERFIDTLGSVGGGLSAATDGTRVIISYVDATQNSVKVAFR